MARSLELRCCGTAGLRGCEGWGWGGCRYGGDRSGIRGLPEGAAAPTPPPRPAPRTLLSYVALEADSTLGPPSTPPVLEGSLLTFPAAKQPPRQPLKASCEDAHPPHTG
ncbi:hypothetical protein K0M31_005420 [Melipona bicolor]|uniref:Uncharacterized protein n=1 Tax=Melipona bicolor TaxID=60889 RepID=A0AA40KMT9_9HYME|nr:hypothetical protein K0M31_005420 [Melipona bicolor]